MCYFHETKNEEAFGTCTSFGQYMKHPFCAVLQCISTEISL